jgi:hypothetical protein
VFDNFAARVGNERITFEQRANRDACLPRELAQTISRVAELDADAAEWQVAATPTAKPR